MVFRQPVQSIWAKTRGIQVRRLAAPTVLLLWLVVVACGSEGTPTQVPDESSIPVSFNTADNLELKGRLFEGGNIGVVLAHQFPEDQSSWWAFGQVLAESGYTALTFNFRGYGDGESRSGGEKELELITHDVEAAISFLQERGASSIFLAGASMGGTASLQVAAKVPVAGVVSLSAPVEFNGLDLANDRITVPVLLMASERDFSAVQSIEIMVANGIVSGPTAEKIIYEGASDHGTAILDGENSAQAEKNILGFLELHSP